MQPPAADPAADTVGDLATGVAADPALLGALIQGVQQADEHTVLLETWHPAAGNAHQEEPSGGGRDDSRDDASSGGHAARWLFSVHPAMARLGRVFRRGGATPVPPPMFCQWLRTRLVGGRITALRSPQQQRLELDISTRAGALTLVLELNRRASNLLLLDAERNLLIALRHPSQAGRKLSPGSPYLPPLRLFEFPKDIPRAERLPAPNEAAAQALAARWARRWAQAALAEQRTALLQEARRVRKRTLRRLDKLEAELQEAGQAEQRHRWGELLQIHRHRLQPGLRSITVANVFEPDQPDVTIPLDGEADPEANVARHFKRARKLRDAAPHVQQRLGTTRAEVAQWDKAIAAFEAAEAQQALQEARQALPQALAKLLPDLPGARQGTGQASGRTGGKAAGRNAGEARAAPMERYSADGYRILVGRSDEENDRLTFRVAKGRDWWFHVQGVPGSHVIVHNPSDGPLPRATAEEAAWLAAYYSKARAQGAVEVDLVQRKHVRRIKGGRPGQVQYAQHKTLLVDAGEGRRPVLERTDPPA